MQFYKPHNANATNSCTVDNVHLLSPKSNAVRSRYVCTEVFFAKTHPHTFFAYSAGYVPLPRTKIDFSSDLEMVTTTIVNGKKKVVKTTYVITI